MMIFFTAVGSKNSRGFYFHELANAKFRENKTLAKMAFSGLGKSCSSREILTPKICLLTFFAKLKILHL